MLEILTTRVGNINTNASIEVNNDNKVMSREEQLISTESTLCEPGSKSLLCVQDPAHELGTEKPRVEADHSQHTIDSQSEICGQGVTYAQVLLSKGVNSGESEHVKI